jgi:hypothetical protein
MADLTDVELTDPEDPVGDEFDINDIIAGKKKGDDKEAEKVVPPYQVYPDSKTPVSKAFGALCRTMVESSIKANELIHEAWEQCFAYYNNHQVKVSESSKGVFSRGDITENIVYSNVNVMLPAVYGRDPDIAVNTTDKEDEEFADCAKALLNALLKGKNLLNCKPKVKKAVGVALMTNFGVLKLDYVLKDDSTDSVQQALIDVTKEISEAKSQKALESAYGKLAAIESVATVFEPGGPKLKNVMAKNLVVDPIAEMPDGTDANWMAERCYISTAFLKHKFTRKDGEDCWVYIFKPTHKAVFTTGSGNQKDDAYGLVLESLGAETSYQENDEIDTYRGQYYTECWMFWDKATRRTSLFAADDWTYPLWVWDNYTKTTRFFPYFIIGFGLSTGQTASVGEVSYYLDQQDEINQINRQISRIRNSIFNFFFYNSHKISQGDAELLMQAVRRGFVDEQSVVGVKVPEGSKISDVFEALVPPSLNYEALFNKEPTINSINRISNTSDAIRGVQYKTNTNEASVQSYQDAARMSVGAKIEVVEDVMSDLCKALLEQCVQNMTKEEVTSLIGQKLAEPWANMSLDAFTSHFALELVPGTSEKPNSIFKKKEAIQVAQAIGQFASSAPMTSMKVALRVLEQAFTEVVIKPEDWDLMQKEMEMNMARGNSSGAAAPPQPGQNAPPPGGAPAGGPPGAGPPSPGGIPPALANLPPEIKQHVEQMHQQGAQPQEIAMFLKAAVQKLQGAGGPPGGGGVPNTTPPSGAPPGGPPPGGPPHPMMQ